jgi:hypothetical protein
VQALVRAALDDLTRPAPPKRVIISYSQGELLASARLAAADPRVLRVSLRPAGPGLGCPDALHAACRLPRPRRPTSYAAVAVDQWRASRPLIVRIRPG